MATDSMAKGPGHPFYVELNKLLARAGFDTHAQGPCEKFYVAGNGRPSVAPGVYFRMRLIGSFEGIDSERGIAWRSADSLGLRGFLGYGLDRATPDHSTLSGTCAPPDPRHTRSQPVVRSVARKRVFQRAVSHRG